jgi:hypothetical protein
MTLNKMKKRKLDKTQKRIVELSKNSAPTLFETPWEDAVKNIEENKRRLSKLDISDHTDPSKVG